MGKTAYLDAELTWEWPQPEEIEHYFLAPPDEHEFFDADAGEGFFQNEGAYDTEHLQPNEGRIDIRLMMWTDPDLGVLLIGRNGAAVTRRPSVRRAI